MALRVWLPLNGNLNNQGLSNIISSGTPTFLDDGKIGKCISLTPRVSFTGLPKMEKFTILFWLKVDSCATDWSDSLLLRDYTSAGAIGSGFRFEATTATRACSFHDNTGYAITKGSQILITSSQYGEWHHCGLSCDGQHCYTFIDGVLTYTNDAEGGYLDNYFHIGETDKMVGGMNDLRIYDECLSQKQIKEISKGLIVHYKLDAQIFENANDVSGYLYNAQLSDNGIFEFDIDDDHSARHIKQLKFYDTASYIKLPQLNTSGFANSCTIVYWAKIADMNGRMAWGFSDGNRLNIYPTGSVICCNTGDGSSNPYQNNGVSVTFSQWNNGWHQFAMVIDDTTNKLYVDGIYQGTAKTYKAITGTQIYLSGWDTGTSYTWTGGQLSDFRIYATALSADEILKLYENCGIIDNKNNIYAYDFREETVYVPV